MERKYLPTLAELVDRLSIVQLKAIHISGNRDAYIAEMELIKHDITMLMSGKSISASGVHAILAIMLTNHAIWVQESKAREGGDEQDKLLKLTHSINGQRNAAKNILAREMGERVDLKIDCFAASLVQQFGNWQIFNADQPHS